YLIVASFLLARMSMWLLLITLIFFVISFSIQAFLRSRELLNLRIIRARMTEFTGLVIDMVTGIRTLKTYLREDGCLSRLDEKHSAALTALRKSHLLSGFSNSGSLLINGAG